MEAIDVLFVILLSMAGAVLLYLVGWGIYDMIVGRGKICVYCGAKKSVHKQNVEFHTCEKCCIEHINKPK